MKSKTLLSVIFLLFVSALFAQDSTKTATKPRLVTHMMTLQLGYSYMTNDVLRQMYVAVGDELNQNYYTLGLACTSEYKRFIYGVTIQGGITQPITIQNYNSNGLNYQVFSNFQNALLQFGYAVVNTKKFKLYPIIGVGAGRVALQVQSQNAVSITQLNSQYYTGTESNIFKYNASFDAGIGADFFLKAPKSTEEKEYGAILGVRIGYTQGIGIGNWGYDAGTLTDNPSYNPSTIYIKANIGFYGKSDRNNKFKSCGIKK
jgi:opacity protein-like surface antigen